MQQPKPTVSDIASKTGLSPSTVSRVLNGSQLIAEQTRRLVEDAARDLGYKKRAIRRHGRRAVLTIALFLPRTPSVYRRLFYDVADLIAGLTEGFGEVRTQISVNVNQPQPELFSSKKSGNVDGCVFGFTTPSPSVHDLLVSRGIPTILLNRERPDSNFVSTDHSVGHRALVQRAKEATTDFRPCFLSFTPAAPVAQWREESFIEACRSENVPCTRADIIRVDDLSQIDQPLVRAIRARYSTVFCFNDYVAVYFYQVALTAHVAIPEDLGLAGYDDSPVRRLTPQPIDTVLFSPYRFGNEAGTWLYNTIIERSPRPLQIRIPGEPVFGATLCKKNL